jgi:hypothetical protein
LMITTDSHLGAVVVGGHITYRRISLPPLPDLPRARVWACLGSGMALHG